jgi:hypothetical protein
MAQGTKWPNNNRLAVIDSHMGRDVFFAGKYWVFQKERYNFESV